MFFVRRLTVPVCPSTGGHTSEALSMVSALDFSRYRPRTYIISEGDALSARKAHDLEHSKLTTSDTLSGSASLQYTVLTIPRARRVHQTLLSTPPTALYSLLSCIYHVTVLPLLTNKRSTSFAEVLLLNGPGTCFTLCLAVYLNRLLGLASPRLLYVESFARVQSLSLSGKLLSPLVDRFVVQWPGLVREWPKALYRGWMV